MIHLDDDQKVNLLTCGNSWDFYESNHEIRKYTKRLDNFLVPILQQTCVKKILEIGCGSGYGTVHLKENGYNAWGVDPNFRDDVSLIHPFLKKGSGLDLPFEDNSFDLVFTLEVIEHIGTVNGGPTVAPDCHDKRKKFVGEICRVSKKWVVLTTPNKYFFIDEHREEKNGKFGFRFHSPFEKFTLSANELEKMFNRNGFGLSKFLDSTNYYEFERVKRRFGKFGVALANSILSFSARRPFAKTFLNPHLFLLFQKLQSTK